MKRGKQHPAKEKKHAQNLPAQMILNPRGKWEEKVKKQNKTQKNPKQKTNASESEKIRT